MTNTMRSISPARPWFATVAVLAFGAMFSTPILAGGGPENVLVVVNPQSPDSLAIAEHYVSLRQIPEGNVLHLPWYPKLQTTDVETFRQKILGPILSAIQARGLTGQIDCVAYSSDFPWAIDAKADAEKLRPQTETQAKSDAPPKGPSSAGKDVPTVRRGSPDPAATKPRGGRSRSAGRNPTCSINGLTYLHQAVMAANPSAYLSMQNNHYLRPAVPLKKDASTMAFRSTLHFGPGGELVDSGGASYLLCVVLGVTAGRGNSVPEVQDYLRRSAEADGTHPKGTIYFCKNDDIRSRIRQDAFAEAVAELQRLGVAAEIIAGVLPPQKKDVQGAMIGIADFDWKASGSTILPGAICEHLTSFGGIMHQGAGQTPLSAFLRCGAAAASGTVVEPFALQDKFPRPSLHVHYARGCTLAEAFYQSVYGPYQLLIVGDPLCRPWANIPKVTVEGVQPGQTVKGTLTLAVKATVPGGGIERFELFIDGRRNQTVKPDQPLVLDTSLLGNGRHELRVVAIESGPIQSQGRSIMPVVVENTER